MPRTLEVALLPAEAIEIDADCYVVIDAFRATTTIATLFARGLRSLTACARIEDAHRLKAETGALLFGEVGGLAPPGFDHGNSPVEASSIQLADRAAVLFTTNGTAALVGMAAHGVVLAGAFANATAIARATAEYHSVLLVCAGNAGGKRFALEDFAAAGAIARAMLVVDPSLAIADTARLAKETPPDRAARSNHADTLRALGLTADIAFAIRLDTANVAPRVVEHGDSWAKLSARA